MIKKTKILLLFLMSFQAYGQTFYPAVNNTSPVFQLPPQQQPVHMLPWCPFAVGMACVNALASQAQFLPGLSTQSYSIPMLYLNNKTSSTAGGVYDRIHPKNSNSSSTKQKRAKEKDFYLNETTSRKQKKKQRDRAIYFRNVDTGDILVKKDGKIFEGPLVYVPTYQLNNPNNAVASTDNTPFPTPAIQPDEKDKDRITQQISKQLIENQPTQENSPSSLSSAQAIEVDASAGIKLVETELPKDLKSHCLIGGLVREKMKDGKCPTKGNSCPNKKDGFRCGPIFNSICISRTPIKNLSKRCAQKSGDIISEENYKKLLENDPVAEFCKINSTKANCRNYPNISQLSQVEQEAGFCEDCDATSKPSVSPENQAVSDVVDASLSHDFTDMLSDSLFDRSKCVDFKNCSGHDSCQPGGPWKTKNWKKDVCRTNCSKKKKSYEPKNKCAGYFAHSLNSTLREYFKDYCKKHNPKGKCKVNSNSICEKNFVSDGGFCFLNLDGKDRIDGKLDSEVRATCNFYAKGFPTHITNDDGKSIPLFKEIPIPKDPDDLPVGAIIVSKIRSKWGHVEVKTNKSKSFCSKTETCFCSDVCTSRTLDHVKEKRYDPKVAFILNPEAAAEAKKAKGYSDLTTSFPFLLVFFPPNNTQDLF